VRAADVPAGPLIVDTDVFSYLRTRRDRHAEFAELIGGHVLTVSFATYGEILAGGHKANLGQRRMDELRRAQSGFVVLPYSRAVVEAWAPLHAKLSGHLQTVRPGLAVTARVSRLTFCGNLIVVGSRGLGDAWTMVGGSRSGGWCRVQVRCG